MTPAFLMNESRELLWDIVEAVTGARVTISYTRIGGVTRDITPDTTAHIERAFVHLRGILVDCDKLLTRNRIFYDRMSGIGILSQEEAISYGLTGPLLRSTGVPYDVRKAQPYSGLRALRLRGAGRNDRRQLRSLPGPLQRDATRACASSSRRLRDLPDGPVRIDDPRFVLPEKSKVYNSIEGLMHHFKLIMEGAKVPAGRGLSGGRGRQRRARLLSWSATAAAAPTACACARPASWACRRPVQDVEGPHGGGHHPDLRHDQHDRRRVRPVVTGR